jgi:glutamate synthase (NADPH/NADH) large chain
MTLTSFVGPQKNVLVDSEQNCRRVKVMNPVLLPEELAALDGIGGGAWKMGRIEMIMEGYGLQVTGYSSDLNASFCSQKPVTSNHEPVTSNLSSALDALVAASLRAVRDDGVSLLVLSDRAALDSDGGACCAIPSLLACGAVHHALIDAGLRMDVSIIVESAEPREVMHFALLFGYGADLIVPYGALAAIAEICRSSDAGRVGAFGAAQRHYRKGLQKALLKVMSKMGTSTLRSYRGAQIFEAIGLASEVMEKCFRGTDSRIGGAGFAELEQEALSRTNSTNDTNIAQKKVSGTAAEGGVLWAQPLGKGVAQDPRTVSGAGARGTFPPPDKKLLDNAGQYRYRKSGERHAWNPDTIYLLQWAARTGDYGKFKQFTKLADELNQTPHVIRGLLDFRQGRAAVPLGEVESVENIMRRFTTGAMSFGSISKEAHETIARAMNSINGRSNSGEGGEDPARFVRDADGGWRRSAIKQVASARFGVTSEYIANAVELQIKIAQGAKPGEGGQLPGHKVDISIARVRHSTAEVTLISPPPHHDIYSIEDLAELIFDLKCANPEARISVKLVSEAGVGTIAAGVAKAHADNILISGYDGGTGASPQSSIRHAGLPWELGLSETHPTLVRNGLRSRVRLQTDGQIKTGRDIVIGGMLGAEEFGFGTSALVVLGCVMMRKCHENTCPMGVATQDPELRKRFTGKSEHLVNFFRFLAQEVREIMAELGFRYFDELVGQSDLLVQRQLGDGAVDKSTALGVSASGNSMAKIGVSLAAKKAAGVDLSRILHKETGPSYIAGGAETHCTQNQIHKIDTVLDRTLIEKCRTTLERKTPCALQQIVKNTDRAVGAMLSYEVSKRYGGAGLPDNFITVDFTGSAGQSFGAFLAPGITFRLAGDTNDYLGKSLSGGRIAVFPPPLSTFKSNENIIVGNTVLYGATSGELYAAGIAGERFCVRNSGATAVVEGAGDHCAEYMTGGRLVVLGDVGRNFAAGMSGGIAYVLDRRGNFEYYLNSGMVELSGLETIEDEEFVKNTIRSHIYWTGSAYAQSILDAWATERLRFIKILPVEYKLALQKQKVSELDAKLFDIRAREEIGEKA